MGNFIYIEKHDLMLVIIPGIIDDHKDVAEAEKEITELTGIKTVILAGESFTFVPEGKK